MSPETRAQIFEPFFTTRTHRPGTQGTGLGLSTVQRIVTEVGGFVDVESAPGRGTTVTVYFPRAAGTPPHPAPAEEPRRGSPPPNSRRVLVIEDDPSVRSLVANVLLGAHYRVVVARDGEEGLRLLETEAEPFHLVISDLVMPRLGGVALAQRLRDRRSGNHRCCSSRATATTPRPSSRVSGGCCRSRSRPLSCSRPCESWSTTGGEGQRRARRPLSASRSRSRSSPCRPCCRWPAPRWRRLAAPRPSTCRCGRSPSACPATSR